MTESSQEYLNWARAEDVLEPVQLDQYQAVRKAIWNATTLALCLALIQASCGPSAPPGVVLSDSAGVTIATATTLPSLDDSAVQWTMTLDWSMPTVDSAGQPLVYQPATMALLGDGTVVIWDESSPHLVIMDPATGSVVRRFGRQGGGPGEVAGGWPLAWTGPSGDLWVYDMGNNRVTRFERHGTVVSELSLIDVGGARMLRQPQAFTGTTGMTAQILRVTDFATNTLVDSVARIDLATGEMRSFMALPPRPPRVRSGPTPLFAPATRWTALPSGDVVVGNTHQATFRVYDSDGALRRELRLPLKPRKIPESDKAKILEDFGVSVRPSTTGALPRKVGDQYPMANMLYPLDDTIFAMYQGHLSLAAGDPALPRRQTVWRLVATSGRYAGALWFPLGFTPTWWGSGRILGMMRDSLGVKTIQAYRLEAPGGQAW